MRTALLFILMLLTACDQGPTLERLSGPTMGSSYSIQYVREPGGPAPAQVQAAVETLLQGVDQHYSTYRGDSTVSRFNQLPANQCLALPPDMLELVALGQRLAEQSAGAFDLTVEPLLDLWGFGPQARAEQVPDPQALAQARQRVGYRHLHIDGQALCKDAPVQVDFNSIAAGHAVDLIAERLRAMGIGNFIAEATGELKAVGHKPDGSAWRIALELPREDRQIARQIIPVNGLAVSTSGDYRHYFEQNGRRYSHTFDARLGRPVDHSLAAVTVLDASALQADGYSTLLLILGPERGWDFAVAHELAAVLVTRAEGGFVSRATPAFERAVKGE
ncbi:MULTISPECIES: FAD:protein FMN transferase [Pseudomonas]|uniref:FAD:protein FMN transferase n=1 Tax=Pseudomonas taiwanensis TaxID=470150 RepID=A0ABR6V9A0_9PSED|nr:MULTISPECIES: FAD:protein FMN transferase [Pseudomonas]MBC3476755.1 FAD:protein FMN transferase [Pseudomonas taiwanensis]MBC3492645.1 FAD:protein FMN transferase [Pseudomonas taiwanensis]MDT8921795.1 FAD:protein FMN transferase [Pseudomonas taiwanensis]QQZ37854.1 FAD:protein FMN transferase [Pseudomonas sp. SK2]WEZ90203.1 FAD:protein FMN transferase [Pseudomonas sp. NyZ480]